MVSVSSEITNGAARRSEIEQHRQAVILNLNVIQRDVAVQITLVVDRLMAPKSIGGMRRIHASLISSRFLFAQTRPVFTAVKQRPHIGRVVLHPETQYVQQVRVVKARQQAGFPG